MTLLWYVDTLSWYQSKEVKIIHTSDWESNSHVELLRHDSVTDVRYENISNREILWINGEPQLLRLHIFQLRDDSAYEL